MTVIESRRQYSLERLQELEQRIQQTAEGVDLAGLTIFTVGSYGRLEASQHSDIDLFFMYSEGSPKDDRRTSELRLFGRLIDLVEEMGFPKFSNDSQFLQSHLTEDVLKHLGSPTDDAENYFTTRMLLLLESRCLFGQADYDDVVDKMLESYYRDYPKHEENFRPWFLFNDIMRYWKTLLLNYENKRMRRDEEDSLKPRVKNFKLKFSRAATCFATICAIGSVDGPVDQARVRDIIGSTPLERLRSVGENIGRLEPMVRDITDEYEWFMSQTALQTDELEAMFVDRASKVEMFKRAHNFGTSLFQLLREIDRDRENDLLRSLVV